MKLYSGPLSLFTAKVRIALDEKGLDYERIEVGWTPAARYEPHHPDVVALNPKKQVPVLVDGDTVVTDSTVILEYLEDRYPETPLFPADPATRARCRHFEAWADEVLFAPLWDLIETSVYATGSAEESERRAGAIAGVEACAGVLDAEVPGGTPICGDFSVADIGAFVMLSAAASLGAPVPSELGNLIAWLGKTASRPAVRREIEAMLKFQASVATG